MDAYLRVGPEGGELPVEGPVGLFRDPEDDHQIVATIGGEEYPLGVSDPTVSRADGEPPLEVVPREQWVEIHNNGNENGLTVATSEGSETVKRGFATRVDRDATLEVGVRAHLQLVVEQPNRYDIDHEGDGDIVLGDQSVEHTDARTSVGDGNVIKGDIGDSGGEEPDSEEEYYCDRHDRSFTGDICPDCAQQLN